MLLLKIELVQIEYSKPRHEKTMMSNTELMFEDRSTEISSIHKLDRVNKPLRVGLKAFIDWSADFPSWEPNSLHWVAPSNWLIRSDGSWYIYASHVANMRRMPGPFDTGWNYDFGFSVAYQDSNGTVIHAADHHLVSLKYKEERNDVPNNGLDPRYAEIRAQIVSASGRQYMR